MVTDTLIDVPGFRVGHATNLEAATGCTVILCPSGTVGGVDVRGGGPGTRETDLLHPHNSVEEVHAVVLSGGSAYGLAAADGVMRYLEEQKTGYSVGPDVIVPIVPSAILFDLFIGDSSTRPDAEMGYQACLNASNSAVEQGTVGAGTGCTVGKLGGMPFSTKAGIGSASVDLGDGLFVAAIVAVNAIGEVLTEDAQILAGVRDQNGAFKPIMPIVQKAAHQPHLFSTASNNTVIGAIATNAKLSKAHTNKVAQMAHDGLARAVRPAHTMHDGDTIFALASGEIPSNTTVIGAFAAQVMARAIRNGVYAATSLAGIRAWNE